MSNEQEEWPERTMRVTGQPSKRGQGFTAFAYWQCKYGVWFCTKADRPIAYMATPYAWTENRLPELLRNGMSYQWTEPPRLPREPTHPKVS